MIQHPLPFRLATLIRSVALLLAAGANAHAQAPQIGDLGWIPQDAYCAFGRLDGSVPDPAAAAHLLFATELVSDDLASFERGYMRIDGLLRELRLLERSWNGQTERRNYRTFGEPPVEISLTMIADDSRKSAQGQRVFVQYRGMIVASRGTSQRQIPYLGACGKNPGD